MPLRLVRRQLIYGLGQNIVRQMIQKLRDCAESFPATRTAGHGDTFAAMGD
jgi:hypothetical protein